MSNLTKEQIQELFRKSRERQEKLRLKQEAEKEAEKARMKARRQLVQQEIKEAQKAKEEALEAKEDDSVSKLRRDIQIYHQKFIERESKEDDLYTLYELQHIEELYPNERGRIKWHNWEKIVEQVRHQLHII